jgi:ribosomal protein L7Ae-like RNA K-turn-binding protein
LVKENRTNSKAARQQGSKAARQQGSKAARQQGSKAEGSNMTFSYADAMKKKRPPPMDNSSKPTSSTSKNDNSQQQAGAQQRQPQPQEETLSVARVPQSAWGAPRQAPPAATEPRNPRSPWGKLETSAKVATKREESEKQNLGKEKAAKNTTVQILSKDKSQNERQSPWKTAATTSSVPNKKSNTRQQPKAEKISTTSGPAPKGPLPNQQQPKKMKPKPQLKSMSIGDMISTRPNQQKPKKQQQQQLNNSSQNQMVATDSTKDFPALGSSPSKTNTTKPVLGKASWAKPVASSKAASRHVAPSQPKKGSGNQSTKKVTSVKSESAAASASAQSAAMFFQPKTDAPREGDEHQLLRLLQDRNVYQKKGRQRLHPRKKKFTALKKKVLQERLQKWYDLHPEERKEEGTPSPTSARAPATSRSVCVYNYVHPDELEDDDEYNEILDNLQDLANRVGPVKEIFIPRIDRTDSHPAFVHFESAQDAAAAQGCWEGLVVGGETLRVILVREPAETCLDWKESVLQSEASIVAGDSNIALPAAGETMILELSGILTGDDYEDEECMGESLDDLRTMTAQFGKLLRLEPKETNDGSVLLYYEASPEEAETILDRLRNTTIGGNQLSVTIVSQGVTDSRIGQSVVVLENVLTEDDLEDEDCLNESLGDIRELAGRYGIIIDVQVVDNAVKVIYEGPPSMAESSAKAMNGMSLAGVALVARVETNPNPEPSITQGGNLYLHNILTEDDLEDEECLQESLNDIRTLASKHGAVRELGVIEEGGTSLVEISYENGETGAVKSALEEFDGMVVGGLIVAATLRPTLNQEEKAEAPVEATESEIGKRKPDPAHDTPSKKARTDDTTPLYSGDKLIPERFAEAKRVPKVPNAAGPREYAKQVNDERVRPLLQEMLGELMRLQKRAVEEKNTKAKRRLVLGLREAARGIRSHKVKMVVMANNLDEYGAIDEKLQEIIDLAHNEGVPLFFEFTKRSLGKAVGKSIKIAVVGVQNAEGAHQQFKKLVSLASKI